MLLPAAPRAFHGGNSKFRMSGTKFVSHWWRPGLTSRNSPSPLEVAVLPGPLAERERVVEDELRLVEDVEDDRQVRHGREPGRLGARPIEDLVLRVHRNAEYRRRSPLERVALAVRFLDGRSPAARDDVDQLVVHMLLGVELPARRNLDHVGREEVAATGQVHVRAEPAQPLPWLERHRVAVNGVGLDNRYAFAFHEVVVGEHSVVRVEVHFVAHVLPPVG